MGPAPGDLCLKAGTRARQDQNHAGSRRRSGNDRGHCRPSRHRGSASERAPLRQAAGHHEGQEETARRHEPADLGIIAGQTLKTVKTEPPSQRQKGVMVKDVGELVDALKKKGLL